MNISALERRASLARGNLENALSQLYSSKSVRPSVIVVLTHEFMLEKVKPMTVTRRLFRMPVNGEVVIVQRRTQSGRVARNDQMVLRIAVRSRSVRSMNSKLSV